MSGQSNLFSRFGFEIGENGQIDNNTRAFLSKFTGRIGPAIADVDPDSLWDQIALTTNAIVKEFEAQGWIKRGFDANETALTNAIRAVTMIPAATEWAYAPYEVFRDTITRDEEFVATENG